MNEYAGGSVLGSSPINYPGGHSIQFQPLAGLWWVKGGEVGQGAECNQVAVLAFVGQRSIVG